MKTDAQINQLLADMAIPETQPIKDFGQACFKAGSTTGRTLDHRQLMHRFESLEGRLIRMERDQAASHTILRRMQQEFMQAFALIINKDKS